MIRNFLLIFLLSLGHFAQAEVKVNLNVEYFALTANSPDELQEKLRQKNRQAVLTYIDWQLINEINFNSTAQGCKLRRFDAEVDIKMTLPKWTNVGELSSAHQAWWQDMQMNISQHKHQHKNHIIAAVKGSAREYSAIGEKGSCTGVRNEYLQIKEKYAAEVKAKDQALDVAVGNGLCFDFLLSEGDGSVVRLHNRSEII
jgi:predicted secreted Zn-dependent protease